MKNNKPRTRNTADLSAAQREILFCEIKLARSNLAESLTAVWKKYRPQLYVLRREYGIADDDRQGFEKLSVMLLAKYDPQLLDRRRLMTLSIASNPPPGLRKPGPKPSKRQQKRPRVDAVSKAKTTLKSFQRLKSKVEARNGRRLSNREVFRIALRGLKRAERDGILKLPHPLRDAQIEKKAKKLADKISEAKRASRKS